MGSRDDARRSKGEKRPFDPRRQNKKMLKSRGESQDVVENKGPKKWGCTETQDVIENKGVACLTRDVDENKGLNIKSWVNLALECTQKRTNDTELHVLAGLMMLPRSATYQRGWRPKMVGLRGGGKPTNKA